MIPQILLGIAILLSILTRPYESERDPTRVNCGASTGSGEPDAPRTLQEPSS